MTEQEYPNAAATDVNEGRWRDAPKAVPVWYACKWFADAWRIFAERPDVWPPALLLPGLMIAPFTSIFLAIGILNCFAWLPEGSFSWLPLGLAELVGEPKPLFPLPAPLWALLWPMLAGGVALTAQRQGAGEDTTVPDVFSVCVRRPVNLRLLAVGGLAALFAILILTVTYSNNRILYTLFDLRGGTALDESGVLIHNIDERKPQEILHAVLLPTVLGLPLVPGCALAPALVALGGAGCLSGLFKSLWACLRNWKVLMVLLLPPVCKVCVYVLAQTHRSWEWWAVLSASATLLTLPVVIVAPLMTYVAARDIFYESEEPPPSLDATKRFFVLFVVFPCAWCAAVALWVWLISQGAPTAVIVAWVCAVAGAILWGWAKVLAENEKFSFGCLLVLAPLMMFFCILVVALAD